MISHCLQKFDGIPYTKDVIFPCGCEIHIITETKVDLVFCEKVKYHNIIKIAYDPCDIKNQDYAEFIQDFFDFCERTKA